jgi:hypothetical protein
VGGDGTGDMKGDSIETGMRMESHQGRVYTIAKNSPLTPPRPPAYPYA